MALNPIRILLADDDEEDRLFFKEAIEELKIPAKVTTVEDGGQLMKLLNEKYAALPDVLFLDLNMPRKNGRECLVEIKGSETLKHLPVIIYTTSIPQDVAALLYNEGAYAYIRKPREFEAIKEVIAQALRMIANNMGRPAKEDFVLTGKLSKPLKPKPM